MSKTDFHRGLIAAVDVGTTKVCCLIGRADKNGEPIVVGVGHNLSKGVKNGCVTDIKEAKDTWNEIKLAGIKAYFQKQYPELKIEYDVVMNDDILKNLEQYIQTSKIDIITLTSYKRNIFARLFNPGIARKMLFHSDTPLLVINV